LGALKEKHAMTLKWNFAAAFVVAGLVGSVTLGAQATSEKPMSTGQTVTLTACVEKAQKPDTFILTQVADVPAHPATMGRVVYWLDEVKDLRSHVGHQVRIAGKVTEVKPGEMEVKLGEDGKGGIAVEIEGPGRDVRTTPEKAGVSAAGRQNEKDDIKTTLVKLDVGDVTMTAPSCPAK
jgi:hypothetical protein